MPRLFVVAAGLAVVGVLALPLGGDSFRLAQPETATQAHPVAFYDEREFTGALLATESAPVEPMPGVRALIIPHHWVGGALIMRGVRDLAATAEISRVILVGPDHVNAGSAAATTSGLAWQTPFGRLEPDAAEIERLTRLGVIRPDPDVLAHEHSVSGIVHAVKYYMPGASVVPLALRHDMTYAEVMSLAEAVAAGANEHTAVIASVDFSHYLSAPEAAAKDRESVAALEALDSTRIMGYGNDHLDSPPSIVFAMEVARLLGGKRFVLRENTNSGVLAGTMAPPVTSYVEGYFTSP
jgi:AmmeMemoRadiSam system protein B